MPGSGGQRLFTLVLQVLTIAALVYGSIVFLKTGTPSNSTFLNFVPALILFVFNIVHSFVWNFLAEHGLSLLTQMDPITIFFLGIAGAMMMTGQFLETVKAEKIIEWAFSLATFVAGFEAGKLRTNAGLKKTKIKETKPLKAE